MMKWDTAKLWLSRLIKSGFWFWNGTLLITIGFGFIPMIATGIFARSGEIPSDYIFFSILLMLLAPFSMIFAYFYCKSAQNIMRFFYGVEAPIFFLSITRIFLLRELTPATSHLAVAIAIALIAFTFDLRKPVASTTGTARLVKQIGLTFGLFVALYFGSLILFYMPPTIYYTVAGVFELIANLFSDLQFGQVLAMVLYFFVYGGFILVTGLAAFAVFPFFLIGYYGESFLRGWRATPLIYSRAGCVGVLACNILLFWTLSYQPHEKIVNLDPVNLAEDDIAWILENEDVVRAGILNAYLAPYRYLGVAEGGGHIQGLYEDMLGHDSKIAKTLQDAFNFLASPFLYNGYSMSKDQDRASRLYEQVFDKPIQKAETSRVNSAINANYNRDQAEASLLDEQSKDVLLVKQAVTVVEKNGFAEVEVHEVYENQTSANNEILYYFSLPSTAAMTGVWLAQDGDAEKFFAYTVAPRGAAQQVYKDEVRRRVDPALLEQVGLESYRLRVFPVEGRRIGNKTRKTHLWISYVTLPETEETWARPVLQEKRNVFWNSSTAWSLNGSPVGKDEDQWIPDLPRVEQGFLSLSAEIMPGVRLTAKKQQPQLRRNAKVAVLVDTSGSMRENEQAVTDALDALQAQLGAQDADISFYLTGVVEDIAAEVKPTSMTFFGNQSREQILTWFAGQAKGEAFDAVFFVTDSDPDGEGVDSRSDLILPGPTWLLFVDGLHPTYIDDELMRSVVRSGGGVDTVAQQLVSRALIIDDAAAYGEGTADVVGFDNGYLWTVSARGPRPKPSTSESGFSRLAAARFIAYKAQMLNLGSAKSLQNLHGLATTFRVVSPWSSMIVLVNDQQRQALAEAVGKADAFDRETETGKQLLSSPPNDFATVPGTPEPEEWALIIAALAVALYELRRRGYPRCPTGLRPWA